MLGYKYSFSKIASQGFDETGQYKLVQRQVSLINSNMSNASSVQGKNSLYKRLKKSRLDVKVYIIMLVFIFCAFFLFPTTARREL